MEGSMKYIYQINTGPVEMGGGWHLRLLEEDDEAGGGIFPVEVDPNAAMAW
jgi:hypothetical protein